MDLRRILRVLRSHKFLMLGGTALAAVIAFLAYTQLSPEVWQTQSELLITQQSDPYGNATQSPTLSVGSGVSYMASLGPIYAAIANGDVVQGQVRKVAPAATVVATDVTDPGSGADLPLVEITVSDSSAPGARQVAALAATTLERYIERQQEAGGVPAGRRVRLSAVQNGAQTKQTGGPSKTTALLAFVAVWACFVVLAFKLEKEQAPAGRKSPLSGALPGTDGLDTNGAVSHPVGAAPGASSA